MPGKLDENADSDPIMGIGTAIKILREKLLSARMGDEIIQQALEIRLRHLAIALPPDGPRGQLVNDRVLVLGRASGMGAGFRAQRTAFDDGGLTRRYRMLVERGRGEIPMHGGETRKAGLL